MAAANGYPADVPEYRDVHGDDLDGEGEIDFSDIEERYAVHQEDPLACTIVVDGVPIVGEDRKAKLMGAIYKFAAKHGVDLKEEMVEMPTGEDGQSKGFFFATLPSPAEAEAAAKNLTDQFDRKHAFTCIPLSAANSLLETPDEFTAQEDDSSSFQAQEHLKGWLTDPASRDQMVMVSGDDVQVTWNHKGTSLEVNHERAKWTEKYCLWSPSGQILATLHGQGIGLWGGPSFSRIHRFPHIGVNFIDFSPYERYLITLSPVPIVPAARPSPSNPFTEEDAGRHIAIWEVATGRFIRTFPMEQEKEKGAADGTAQKKVFTWPIFKWSADEKYFARVVPGSLISIYETPSMRLLNNKSVKIDGVLDMEWAPLNDAELTEVEEEMRGGSLEDEAEAAKPQANGKAKAVKKQSRENVLAYWLPEVANQPARVALMAVPSMTNLRTKNLFNVADCKLHWQNSGDYLCVKVDRLTKSKKATYCNLEVFRVREKAIPIQVIEIKDTVTSFAWEPKGDRFAVITSNDPSLGQDIIGATVRTAINFYQLDSRKGDFILLKSFDQKTCNRIFWSPRGRHVVFATLGSTSKFDLEFWDVELDKESKQQGTQDTVISKDPPSGSDVTLVNTVEHYGMTGVEWDPSGRYIAAVGSIWLGSIEPGFGIYDFKGAELNKQSPVEKFKQLIWRPRPRTLLSAPRRKQILKNLRQYGREFEEADQLEEMNVSSELQSQRRRLVDEWNAWRSRTKKALEEERSQSGKVQKALEVKEQAATAVLEEWIEEVIEETEEVM